MADVSKTKYTIYDSTAGNSANADFVNKPNAGVSLYNVFKSTDSNNSMKNRQLLNSRLWQGIPQLTEAQMKMFEAAFTGHQFFFVTGLPKFMTTGAFANSDNNMNVHAQNIKTIIERCSVGFSGASSITVQESNQEDGSGRKISHLAGVTKEQPDISLTLHEFAGLPLKNGLEAWVTGVIDPISKRGSYFGNLDIPGGWCLANHTMGLLVVQTDPSWTEVQDAAYYCNMFPTEVPFSNFDFTKGTSEIVQDYNITFKCNEIRSEQVNEAAVKYMQHKILSVVSTEAFSHAKFKPFTAEAIPSADDTNFAPHEA